MARRFVDIPDELDEQLDAENPARVTTVAVRAWEDLLSHRQEMADLLLAARQATAATPGRLMKLSEVATELGWSIGQVRKATKDGTLRSVPVGRSTFVPSQAVDEVRS